MDQRLSRALRAIALAVLLVGLPTGFLGCGGGGEDAATPAETFQPGDGGGTFTPPPPNAPPPITPEEIAETPPLGTTFASHPHASGMLVNASDETQVVDAYVLHVPDARSLRVIFEEIHLGEGSYIEVYSPRTDEAFVITPEVAVTWAGTTPHFNTDLLEIRLHLTAFVEGGYVIHGLFVGQDLPEDPLQYASCDGVDTRNPWADPRVLRMLGTPTGGGGCLGGGACALCSFWLVGTNNCFVSAGHCVDSLAAGFPIIAEANVPNSTGGGNIVFAAVRDQYPVTVHTFSNAPGGGNPPDDWCAGRLGVNNLGETPVSRQGVGFVLDLTQPTPATISLIGYGAATGILNFTQQISTDTFMGRAVGSTAPGLFELQFQAVGRGGASGGPIVDPNTGWAIGLNVGTRCPAPGGVGTDITFGPLQAALGVNCAKAAPSITTCPPDDTVSCSTNNGSEQTYTFPIDDPDGELILVEFRVDGVLQGTDMVAGTGTASFTRTYSSLGGGGPYIVVATATNATGTQDSCTFEVTVTDNPPTIMCPGDITVECTGTSGAAVTFAATVSDDCTTSPTITYVPASGSTFPIGTTPVTATVTDDNGQTDQCSFNVTVEDTTDPVVNAMARRLMLFLPRNGLLDCVLSWSAFDTCDAALANTVTVYSNQDDTGGAFTPDAAVVGSSLEVRAEVDLTAPEEGRIYLIVVESTDDAGNTGRQCTWVIVPKTATAQDVVGARSIAVAADADCEGAGPTPPAGWFTILPTTALP